MSECLLGIVLGALSTCLWFWFKEFVEEIHKP